MKRCVKCGAEKPLADFGRNRAVKGGLQQACRECANSALRKSVAAAKAKDPERAKRMQQIRYQRWYQKNHVNVRPILTKRTAAWREKHPLTDQDRAARRAEAKHRYHANRDAAKARLYAAHKRRRASDPERMRELSRGQRRRRALKHPEKAKQRSAIDNARRRARIVGAQIDRVDYEFIKRRDGMRCHICKKKVRRRSDLHFDHVVPLAAGGAHTATNIAVSHSWCNVRKHARVTTLF